MHVALCSPAWPLAKHHNGIVTYVHWMKLELERAGHRVSVFTAASDSDADEPGIYRVKRPALNAALLRLTGRFSARNRYVFDWGKIIGGAISELHRSDPVDIIEMEETFGWSASVADITSLPVLVKLHGPSFLSLVEEDLSTAFGRDCVEQEGRSLHQAGAIVSPCELTLRQTLEKYDLTPRIAEHIVNPVTLDDSMPRWSLAGCDPKTILFVGRFDKRKGGDLVLDAFAELVAQDPELKLVFVGPDRGLTREDAEPIHIADYLDKSFPPALRSRVDFRGALPQSEVTALRAKCIVTVIASRWENQGYAALEAMLQGCPVVCSDAGGGPEIVADGRTGLLSRTGDAMDLAAKIMTMLGDRSRAAAMGAAARAYVSTVHAPQRVAEQSLRLFERVIQGRAAPRP